MMIRNAYFLALAISVMGADSISVATTPSYALEDYKQQAPKQLNSEYPSYPSPYPFPSPYSSPYQQPPYQPQQQYASPQYRTLGLFHRSPYFVPSPQYPENFTPTEYRDQPQQQQQQQQQQPLNAAAPYTFPYQPPFNSYPAYQQNLAYPFGQAYPLYAFSNQFQQQKYKNPADCADPFQAYRSKPFAAYRSRLEDQYARGALPLQTPPQAFGNLF